MNVQVDGLLNIHVLVIVRSQHIVDRFEHQGEIAELLEMRAVKARFGLLFDGLTDDRRDQFQFIPRGLVGDSNVKGHPALIHATIVADATVQQI